MTGCYAIASGKGGVGKSTVTANLGACLARVGRRVVIVDADLGLRSQDALLGLENRVVYDLLDLTRGTCETEQALLPVEAWRGLFLLPAAQFARAKELSPKAFRKVLATLRATCDTVLIDCPAGIERGLRNVLNAGGEEIAPILVATPDDVSLRSAERAFQLMETRGAQRPRLIVNRLNAELIRTHEMMTAQTAAQVLDLPLLGEIPEDPQVYRAQLQHKLALQYDCEAARAIRRIAERMEGKIVPFPVYGSEKQRWYRRLPRRIRRRRRAVPKEEVTPLDNH